jgi:DNA repair protein RecN (Recombination protein N)
VLLELTIQDFAIIDRLHLSAGPGLTVLTGETGAGKSIIIDALGAVLGGRTGAEYIREGANSAHVEAIVEVPQEVPSAIETWLVDYGMEQEDGSLVLSRDVGRARGVARVNGRVVPTAALQSLGLALVTIHGQTDHLAIQRAADQLELLDRYANVKSERAAMAEAANALRQVRRDLANLATNEREMARRLELLRFQVDEIQTAGLRPGEDELLVAEQRVLASVVRLRELTELCVTLMTGDGSDAPTVEDLLARADASMSELARIDPAQESLHAALVTLLEGARDSARELRSYQDSLEDDPQRLAAVQERLETIKQLKRKYGATIEEIVAFGRSAADEVDALTHREERQAALLEREQALLAEAAQCAMILHRVRSAASVRLATEVECELQDLHMRDAKFSVALRQSPDPSGLTCTLSSDGAPEGPFAFDATGIDGAEFLVTPNVGEGLKPLAKIASGGETSRVMLAFLTVLSDVDQTPTMVFDEVDVGVGGRNGQVIGEKLWQLARRRQIFCITHLPQVAVYGDDHVRIGKETVDGRTHTTIGQLDDRGREDELALMLGGQRASDSAAGAARELLHRASAWKREREVHPDG